MSRNVYLPNTLLVSSLLPTLPFLVESQRPNKCTNRKYICHYNFLGKDIHTVFRTLLYQIFVRYRSFCFVFWGVESYIDPLCRNSKGLGYNDISFVSKFSTSPLSMFYLILNTTSLHNSHGLFPEIHSLSYPVTSPTTLVT